jgi:hypothetical protein
VAKLSATTSDKFSLLIVAPWLSSNQNLCLAVPNQECTAKPALLNKLKFIDANYDKQYLFFQKTFNMDR